MSNFIGVDLFGGIGGMSLGAQMAGISVDLAVEKDHFAAETYRHNHKETKVIEADIRDVNIKAYMEGRPSVVFGGPPCQGFSTSNTKTRNLLNTNNSLFEEFVKTVIELQPDWFVFENVEGFEFFEDGLAVSVINEYFNKANYLTYHKTLLASDYGVPQNRKRFFLVGNRLGKQFSFPEPQKRKITVQQAIGDLPSLNNGDKRKELPYKKRPTNSFTKMIRSGSRKSCQNLVSRNSDYVLERYSYIEPGQNWKAIPERLMDNYANRNNCHSGIYKRLDPKKPSVVISNYRKNMLIHPEEDRGLSVREAARIQSIPDKFIFKGTLMHIQQQIGNAVPPLLAKALFEQILKVHNA